MYIVHCIYVYMYMYSLLMRANKLETAAVQGSLACLAPPRQFFSCTCTTCTCTYNVCMCIQRTTQHNTILKVAIKNNNWDLNPQHSTFLTDTLTN